MPDLMIEHIRTCAKNLFFTIKIAGSNGKEYEVTYGEMFGLYHYDWSCTCPAFKFNQGDCKHIKSAKELKCNWGSEAFMGSHTEANPDGTCPECGGETKVIRVGV